MMTSLMEVIKTEDAARKMATEATKTIPRSSETSADLPRSFGSSFFFCSKDTETWDGNVKCWECHHFILFLHRFVTILSHRYPTALRFRWQVWDNRYLLDISPAQGPCACHWHRTKMAVDNPGHRVAFSFGVLPRA